MDVALRVIAIVLGIALLQALVWIPIVVLLKRKAARMEAALRQEIAASGERVIRGPERASYQSGTGKNPTVAGKGVIVLTDRRLVFRILVGTSVEIPRAEIARVREEKVFLSHVTGGRMHLVVTTKDGDEAGFFVQDNAAWTRALAS